jgi:hypothetical protein
MLLWYDVGSTRVEGRDVHAKQKRSRKAALTVGLVIPIALLHFVTGDAYRGPYAGFVNGYLLDILLPFALYFLLSLVETPLLKHWAVRGGLVVGAAFAVELAQGAGIPLFGRTYDTADLMMYAIGVVLAVVFDAAVLPRVFDFWTPGAGETA